MLTKNCVWSVNEGFNPKRTQWSIDNSVENGDIDAAKKPSVEQVANMKLAEEAVELAGVLADRGVERGGLRHAVEGDLDRDLHELSS